jgi:uncharacterized protein (TIGR03492 family)
MKPRVLAVTNAYGADLVAAEILGHLPGVEATAYPLVGVGRPFPSTVRLLDPRRDFPSGGYALRTKGLGLAGDLRAGMIRFLFAQRRTLRRQRGHVDLTLAVGDLYCLAMARWAAAPIILMATSISVHDGIGPFGLQLFRWARHTFTHDAATAEFLRAHRVSATFVGNPQLDCLRPTGTDFGLAPDEPVVTILPGSHEETPQNTVLLARTAAQVARVMPQTHFLLSLAPVVEDDAVLGGLQATGWTLRNGALELGPARLRPTRAFADALMRATVVLGMAGTAFEQAAGLGRPIVAFPGPGPQFTETFLLYQRHILGECLVAVSSPEEAADAVIRLLRSPEERARRGQIGREREGEPGAAGRIAAAMEEFLRRQAARLS